MILRIRIILDVEEDVFRDLEMDHQATLEEFHLAIAQSFGFAGSEMASFYRSNAQWEQREELPLIDMGTGEPTHGETPLGAVFEEEQHHLIYVYDFMALWTFFVEVMEIVEPAPGMSYPHLVFAQGEVPEEAPEKSFESENESEGEDDSEMNFDDDLDSYY